MIVDKGSIVVNDFIDVLSRLVMLEKIIMQGRSKGWCCCLLFNILPVLRSLAAEYFIIILISSHLLD